MRSRVVNHLLSDQIHNSTVDVCLRLLVGFSRAYGMFSIVMLHTALYQSTSKRLPATVHTMRLHVNDTSSVVGLKGARHHPSVSALLPSLAGASLSVFPFHNLRTYGHFLGDPTPLLVSRPCLLGFSHLSTGGEGVGLSPFIRLTPYYAFQATVLFFSNS